MLQFHFYSNVQFETNPKKCRIRRMIYARTKVFHLCSYILNYTNYFNVFFLTFSSLDMSSKITFDLENTIAKGLKITLLIFQDQVPSRIIRLPIMNSKSTSRLMVL